MYLPQSLTLLVLAVSTVTASPLELGKEQNEAAQVNFHSPPYYPAPKGGWAPTWAESYRKAKLLVEQMTLAEKVNVTTGTGWSMGLCVGNTGPVERLGYPSICLQDGPLGLRFADLITAWPAGITAGATWSRDLIFERAHAMGEEAKIKGVHVILGPAVGPLGRQPKGGRNWEGFGADPYLMGEAAFQAVTGIQIAGVQATIKHYIANEQEQYRGDGGSKDILSANVDDRTLHEVYLWPFSQAVKAGVASVMCSYNSINGSQACENSKLLNGVLKDELGFQGYVMSDWLAQRSGVGSALAGLDMTMPGDGNQWADGKSLWGPELSRSILNSSIPIDRLNDAATRIVAAWYQLLQDRNFPATSFSSWTKNDTDVTYKGAETGPIITVNHRVDARAGHAAIAEDIAREAITLLKNEGNILPLKTSDSIKVFGEHAGNNPKGPNACPDRGCNIGVLTMGWGSGTAELPEDLVSPIDAIKSVASNVEWYNNNNVTADLKKIASSRNAKCIVSITSDAGEVYVVVEGNVGDRSSLHAWHNGDALVKAVADSCKNTIVLIHSVGPIIMEEWIDHPNVKAVVLAHLPGQAAGYPLTDIIFGKVSPSGHLPYTIGKREEDWGSSVKIITNATGVIPQEFTEGLYVDYKWFDKMNIKPRFEFGFGLSYTSFRFSDLKIREVTTPTQEPSLPEARGETPEYSTEIPDASEAEWPASITTRIPKYIYPYLDNATEIVQGDYPYPEGYSTTPKPAPIAGGAEGGNPALWDVIYSVTVLIENTGKVTGKTVPQLYLEFPKNTGYDIPFRQLRGFDKIELKAGEKKRVEFKLTRKDLSVWDVVRQQWIIPGQEYTVNVGRSSRDLAVRGKTPKWKKN
ncbi:beta-glucosidase-related glycosidase [Peziza echinospora]|nr:beta-glucosidase-related glycosidase [Peziza echinospora]